MKKIYLKKGISLLLALILSISLVVPVSAADNSINVQLNGENISFEVNPRMVNNRILVPMRKIFEKLGADVQWDAQTRTITAAKDGTIIKLSLNSRDAFITKNGVQRKLLLDTTPVIVSGKTLVPVRFISESLGKQVGWDSVNRTVVIIDYDYFLNSLGTLAPNFYQFITNNYEVINTGEFNSSGNISFKYNSGVDSNENVSGSFNTILNAKINPESGSADANIKLSGLADVLSGSGVENVENISLNLLFDNNSFYVKSSLFELWDEAGLIGDKWLKADLADLNIADVKTLQDLKELQSKEFTGLILDYLIKTPMNLDINSFREAETAFNILVNLVDNHHFTATDKGDIKVYTWNITKEDLITILLHFQMDSAGDLTPEELTEIEKFAETLEFDFNMVAEVKNNIIVGSEILLNTKMDIPDDGHFELSLKTNSEVLNPNNAHFEIKLPDPANVINVKELLFR